MHIDTLLALGDLTPLRRESVWDMNVLGRGAEDIAADLGTTAACVRTAAYKGREQLRVSLRKDDRDECF